MFLPLLAALALAPAEPIVLAQTDLKTVAILPWSFKGGTDTAVKTAKDTIELFFDKAKYDRMPSLKVRSAWEDQLGHAAVKEIVKDDEQPQDLPSAKDLLALGEKLHVDMVCAGRAKWHTKSVWIALGPKTKADCTVDLIMVDVKKREIATEAHDVKADDTRSESGLETAGAIFISMGITAFSGGPATPHQQKAAQHALGLAFEPWLKTTVSKKIQ
jgi:hypothetical protein